MSAALVRVTAKFEEHEVCVVEVDGQPMWSAQEIGVALGYADPTDVVRRVRDDWSDEFDEDLDYIIAKGDELAALKSAAPGVVDARAPSLMLLTESGVNLVCMLSRKPAGKKLRRWLATEVLPSIRRTGGYQVQVDSLPDEARRYTLAEVKALVPENLCYQPVSSVLELLSAEEVMGNALPEMRKLVLWADEKQIEARRRQHREADGSHDRHRANAIWFATRMVEVRDTLAENPGCTRLDDLRKLVSDDILSLMSTLDALGYVVERGAFRKKPLALVSR